MEEKRGTMTNRELKRVAVIQQLACFQPTDAGPLRVGKFTPALSPPTPHPVQDAILARTTGRPVGDIRLCLLIWRIRRGAHLGAGNYGFLP
jgi:hypothetical protein